MKNLGLKYQQAWVGIKMLMQSHDIWLKYKALSTPE
jgi:hypothetical protein